MITKRKLLKIVEEEETEYKYGGSEDKEGTLHPGTPDFDKIKTAIKKLKINR